MVPDRPHAPNDPLTDPILRSYARCLALEILCVWRCVSLKKQTPEPIRNTNVINLSANSLRPPLSLSSAKELWIFWYGDEPDFNELDPELLHSAGKKQNALIYPLIKTFKTLNRK